MVPVRLRVTQLGAQQGRGPLGRYATAKTILVRMINHPSVVGLHGKLPKADRAQYLQPPSSYCEDERRVSARRSRSSWLRFEDYLPCSADYLAYHGPEEAELSLWTAFVQKAASGLRRTRLHALVCIGMRRRALALHPGLSPSPSHL